MTDIKCPICGETLQRYGEVDPDTGTSIVLGAYCPGCSIGDSDIKLWQELIRTHKALDVAVDALKRIAGTNKECDIGWKMIEMKNNAHDTLNQIKTALEQKEQK